MRKKMMLKLSHRLMAAFTVLAVLVAASGVYGIVTISNVNQQVQTLIDSRVAQIRTAMSLEITQKASRVNLLEAAMVPRDVDLFEDYAAAFRKKRELFHDYLTRLTKGDVKEHLPAVEPGSAVEQQINRVRESWKELDEVGEQILQLKQQLLLAPQPLNNGQEMALDQLSTEKLQEATEGVKKNISTLNEMYLQQLHQAEVQIERTRKHAILTFSGVTAGAVLLAYVFGILTARAISRRIDPLVAAFNLRAAGDLTARVPITGNDELGIMAQDFNGMANQLAVMIRRVSESTNELGAVSVHLMDATGQVATSANQQAEEVASVTSAIIVLNSSIEEVGAGVNGLADLADETSSSIMEMGASIDEVAQNTDNLSQSVEGVSSSVTEMTASIKQISSSITTLMDVSVMTASSVAGMDASVKVIERNALDVATLSQNVKSGAEEGRAAAEEAIVGMQDIRRSAQEATEAIDRLQQRAEAIDSILAVIDEITEQTNLLALNAAIIAAQAGEHGKGFAVVADEIRELAERTGTSTREIGDVILSVQNETQQAVSAIRQAESTIARGEGLTLKTSEVLLKTIAGVSDTSRRMDEIAQSTVQQSQESQQISLAMDRVAEMVSQIARATSEQSRGTEQAMSAVGQMRDITGHVRLSAIEQARVSNFIMQSTARIIEVIGQIKVSCNHQKNSSKKINEAAEGVDHLTRVNLEAVRVMDSSMASLLTQIQVLQKEMNEFKV